MHERGNILSEKREMVDVFTTKKLVLRKRIHAFVSVFVLPFLALVAILSIPSLSHSELIFLIIITVSFYVLGQLGITMGFHRYFSHQSFTTGPVFAALLGILGSMGAQGSILYWASDHRRHHSFGDIPGDLHSPYFESDTPDKIEGTLKQFLHAQFGWMFAKTLTHYGKYSPDLFRDKLVMWITNRYFLWVFMGLALPALLGIWGIGGVRGAYLGMFWGGFLRLFLAYQMTWATNSLNHMIGMRDYPTPDKSTNIFTLGIFGFGEGWHNNHHAFPNSAKFGHRWWQFDITWLLLNVLKQLKIVSELRAPTLEQIQRKRQFNPL